MLLPPELLSTLSKSVSAPICHVDDDEIHLTIVDIYYEQSGLSNPYLSFEDGDEFLAYLEKVNQNDDELPLIVLMDINMPGKNGFEVVEQMRSCTEFKDIPVCSMLSSSTYQEDIDKSFDVGANHYLVKPDDAKAYETFFRSLSQR